MRPRRASTARSTATTDVGTLFDLRRSDRQEMRKGIAAAIAMPDAPMPTEPGRVGYAVQGGTFRGQYAAGVSLNYRLPTANPMAINARRVVRG